MQKNKKNIKNSAQTLSAKDARIENGLSVLEQSYSGPIPPPAFLKAYEEIVPGSANRILSMAEKNSDHSIQMDKEQISLAHRHLNNQQRGQNYTLICFVIVAGLSGYAIHKGYSTAGIAVLISEIVALAGVFICQKYIAHKKINN